MTSPVATIGLTYQGTSLQELHLGMFLRLVRGLSEPASVRGEDQIVPGRWGRLARPRVKDRRMIELVGIVAGRVLFGEDALWYELGWIDEALVGTPPVEGTVEAGADERTLYRMKARAFRTLFDPTVMGELVATPEDGSTRSIQARTVNVIWDHVIPSVISRVSVELESLDPEWEYVGL